MELLTGRARARLKEELAEELIDENSIKFVAEKIFEVREEFKGRLIRPGAAEFMDAVKALIEIYPKDLTAQREAMADLEKYVIKKDV